MPLIQVVILALVQGLTEFLPISSTAHLYLTSWLLGWQVEGLDFDIALHIGTLLAVLVYFFRDWVQIVAQGVGLSFGSDPDLRNNRRMLWLLVLATIPVGVFGLLFNEQAETTWRNPFVIGSMLILVGILMWIAENAGRQRRGLSGISVVDAAAIGASQALAIVPGTSRSGITITAGLFRDLTRESAARFSFLLSTPAIAAAALKSLHAMQKAGRLHDVLATDFLLGVAISGLTGLVVIAWFLQYLKRAGLRPFVYYRIVFGIIVIALAFIRRPA